MPDSRFDGPDCRLQRLMVLTGGAEPSEQFQIKKALVAKSNDTLLRFADVVFTDVGLFMCPYGQYSTSSAAGAALVGGLVLAASMKVGETVDRKRASSAYDRGSSEDGTASPKDRFTRRGEFLPADEIEAFTRTDKIVEATFRKITYSFAAQEALDVEQLNSWLADAKAKRGSLSGGPPRPGLAALLEWGQRRTEDRPPWLNGSISEFSNSAQDILTSETLTSATAAYVGKLIERLEGIGTDDAFNLSLALKGNVAARAKRYFAFAGVFAVLTVIALVLVFSFSPFLPPSQSPNAWVGGVSLIPAAAFPLVALGLLIAGFNVGSKAKTSSELKLGE